MAFVSVTGAAYGEVQNRVRALPGAVNPRVLADSYLVVAGLGENPVGVDVGLQGQGEFLGAGNRIARLAPRVIAGGEL